MKNKDGLEYKRHTLAHLLASAVLEIYPDTKNTIGPAIENGFYYDFEFTTPLSENDLGKIEKKMKENLKSWNMFTHEEKTSEQAQEYFKDNPYKLELINEIIEKGEKITFYTCGNFTDLCRGGHSENPKAEINKDSFKLDRIAGAYWRGDEENKMLTRIYGLAYDTKEELDAYINQREEARKRDHKKLGKELELFTTIDEIGPGLPLFYPKGALLRRTIENYIQKVQEDLGYEPIWIPHITKENLYKISGHLDKYDAMYSPMEIDGENYYLKPMNCPHFMMLYKTKPHSYKELPVRYTCTTTNYRYEKSGELAGLTRVRALTQDDCHVFCEPTKIKEEINLILEMIKQVYSAFGLTDFYVRISLRDSKDKSKYLGSDEVWNTAESALREVVQKTGWKYEEAEDEAAFYGPKLDFMFKDAIGRQWQLSTVQLDFNLPERFELEYMDNEGNKTRPVVIHRAILGSTERFMGVMIEHYAGAFPTWLSPVQVSIVPVRENHIDKAREIYEALKNEDIRVELEDDNNSLGKRINHAKAQKVPYVIVLGDKELESGNLTIESRTDKKEMTLEDFILKLKEEVKNKTLN